MTTTLIQHTTDDLRAGLRRILLQEPPSGLTDLEVQDELLVAGLVRGAEDGTLELTPAGRRFL